MGIMTITVNSVGVGSIDTLLVNFNWYAFDGVTAASDSGEEEFPITDSSTVINQKIIDACVARAAAVDIMIAPTDRKVLVAGLAN